MAKTRNFTQQEIEEIINLYQSGKATRAIASIFSVAQSTIFHLLKRNNILLRDPWPDECWEWQINFTEWGYGAFEIMENGIRTRERAHRFSWVLAHGEIPDNLQVLHHCDNPPCVNPAHLFLGTQKDNIDDMFRKGRQASAKGKSVKSDAPGLLGEPVERLLLAK